MAKEAKKSSTKIREVVKKGQQNFEVQKGQQNIFLRQMQ